jgi:hypothetical protein
MLGTHWEPILNLKKKKKGIVLYILATCWSLLSKIWQFPECFPQSGNNFVATIFFSPPWLILSAF